MTRSFTVQDRGVQQVDQPAATFASPDAEIWFNIRSVLDNGTVVGGRVELEGSTEGDQIDESYLFVEKHDIGRIEVGRSEEHTSELQSLMRISYAVFCLKKKT